MIEVLLDPELWERAERIGHQRYQSSKRRGSRPKWAYEEVSGKDTHIWGARGEAAFAQALGLTWTAAVDAYREVPDVLPNWEVRTTPSTRWLKVARDDPPDRLVAFVLNERGSPRFALFGYIIAGWAQDNIRARDPGSRGEPAHFVPAERCVPFPPDFHSVCGWTRSPDGWRCLFCGASHKE